MELGLVGSTQSCLESDEQTDRHKQTIPKTDRGKENTEYRITDTVQTLNPSN